jgi:hypothetical protein
MEEGVDSKDLRERLRWLVGLRWIGILSVFVTTHVVRELSALSFSLIPVYAILGFAALYNLFFSWSLRFPNHDARKIAVAQIFLDQFTLALAMYFSGGCDSPFIYFFIFHIVISGILLPWGYTLVFAFLAVLFPMAVMGLKHYGILPHFGIFKDEPMLFTNLTVVASYGVAFVATIFLTAYFVTYLSRRLHEKNEEIRRLYALSERLRSSIRIAEVISIIERELCGFTGINGSRYIPLDKSRRVLTVSSPEKELNIPLVDSYSLTESLLRGAPMAIDYRTIASDYEKEVMDLMGAKKVLLLPVLAASLSPC